MAESQSKSTPKSQDAGQDQVQKQFDEAAKQGYFGERPPGLPNERYSLESGPDAPTHAEEREAAKGGKK
jgi:hypothetical protein